MPFRVCYGREVPLAFGEGAQGAALLWGALSRVLRLGLDPAMFATVPCSPRGCFHLNPCAGSLLV